MEYNWVSVKDHMPIEHDSLFKRFKGTSLWSKGMFESISDEVLVSVKFADGTRRTYPTHTTDGMWHGFPPNTCVTHWTTMPEYKE